MAAKRQRRESPRPRPLTGPSGRKLPPRRAATLQRSEVTRPFHTWTYEVNARCLELLGHRAGSASPPMGLTAELRELEVLLDPVVRTRLAARPYLLVNMRFQDESWWQAARRAPKARASPHQDVFPRGAAIKLARAVLILAWNGLRSNPAPASVLYGISAPVARVIVHLTLDDIEEIARRHFRQVKPRWDDRPAVWQDLILAARAEKASPMSACNLHALQLLTGELLGTAGTAAATRATLKSPEPPVPFARPTDVARD